ncbi:MAG TPA: MFS transporter, partial [Chitinophagaceae bacterium]|nr:MFS transporter [Chitinophagaceae bacterium]
DIVKVMGLLALATGIFYSFIQFPPSKKLMLPASTGSKHFLKDPLLYMIAFFLFFQGSMEAILNNWTTTYFTEYLGFKENVALYALSLYLAGMTVMRLLIGSVLRSVPLSQLMFGSMGLMLGGILLVAFGKNYFSSVCGLTLCGVGLAAGFPIMLGMAGSRYASNSATAFSIILTIALVGNMLVNILMGFISGNFGIRHLTTVFVGEWLLLVILAAMIFSRREKPANNTVAMEKEITV